MTAQPRPVFPSGALRLPPLPDPPRKTDMQENMHFDRPGRYEHSGALSGRP